MIPHHVNEMRPASLERQSWNVPWPMTSPIPTNAMPAPQNPGASLAGLDTALRKNPPANAKAEAEVAAHHHLAMRKEAGRADAGFFTWFAPR